MIEWIGTHLAVLMFLVLTFIMFIGYPVAFVLGGIALGFGVLGIIFDVFNVAQFQALMPRLLELLAANEVLRDRGMILVLDRYSKVPGLGLHQGLRGFG